MPPKNAKKPPKCAVGLCNKRMDANFGVNCPRCNKLVVCKEHKYDHECDTAPKPPTAASVGLKVKKKSKPAKATNGSADPKSNGAKPKSNKLSDEEVHKLREKITAFVNNPVQSKTFVDVVSSGSESKLKAGDWVVLEALGLKDKQLKDFCLTEFLTCSFIASCTSSSLESFLKGLQTLTNSIFSSDKLSEEIEKTTQGLLTLLNQFYSEIFSATDSENILLKSIFKFYVDLLQKCDGKKEDLVGYTVAFTGFKDLLASNSNNSGALDLEGLFIENMESILKGDSLQSKIYICCAALKHVDCSRVKLVDFMHKIYKVLESSKKKDFNESQFLVTVKLLKTFAKELKQIFLPFILLQDSNIFDLLLNTLFASSSKSNRSEIKKLIMGFTKVFTNLELHVATPFIFTSVSTSASWRCKTLGFSIISSLCSTKASKTATKKKPGLSISRYLPQLMETILLNLADSKAEVSKAAATCLDSVSNCITNPEINGLIEFILPALKDYNKIEPCLDEIMDTTFVNVISVGELAIVLPLIHRALRQGGNEMVRKALITISNICSLVGNVNDVKGFLPIFIPILTKLADHSSPDIRKLAVRAVQLLSEGLNVDVTSDFSSKDVDKSERLLEARTGKLVQLLQDEFDALEDANDGFKAPDPVVRDYIVNRLSPYLLKFSLHDLDSGLPMQMVRTHVTKELKSVLSGLLDSNPDLQNMIIESTIDLWMLSNNRLSQRRSRRLSQVSNVLARDSNANNDSEKDYLVYIPSIILAFASRLLLRRTKLFFERNRVYGFVGQNGVGKTTMLNRLADRDILGFPQDAKVFYVRHEIVSEDKSITVRQYLRNSLGRDSDMIEKSLNDVGFGENMKNSALDTLSGGWKMKLAVAESMLFSPDLLLLDEPTNHLDLSAVAWLTSHLNGLVDGTGKKTTIAVVSHDYDFLTDICSDIVHIHDQKLTYYRCGFKDFQKLRPEIVAALPKATKKDESGSAATKSMASDPNAVGSVLEALGLDMSDPRYHAAVKSLKPITFPQGSKLEGLSSRGKTVIGLDKVVFGYPGSDKVILQGITCRLNLNSRVALIGKNGAGKSTLLKLLVGVLDLDVDLTESESAEDKKNQGKIEKHHNLRTAYIAQHALHHLEENLEKTPCQYIQKRFHEGRDKEISKMCTLSLTEEEEEKIKERGEVCKVVSRVKRGKKLYYEVMKTGRTDREGDNKTEMKTIEELQVLGKTHAVKLCRMFDERMKASNAGIDIRPLTTPELVKHLKEFGIEEQIAQRKIRWMSGGQKSRLVLAAAMWTRPHLIALDEPTNYLDNDTLAALTAALRSFRGGVVTISHHEGFVNALAKELWEVKEGKLTVQKIERGK